MPARSCELDVNGSVSTFPIRRPTPLAGSLPHRQERVGPLQKPASINQRIHHHLRKPQHCNPEIGQCGGLLAGRVTGLLRGGVQDDGQGAG
jgi:hypothetical protein